jgi:hypothetical protein
MEPNPSVHFIRFPRNETPTSASFGSAVSGVRIVTSKNYTTRQAVILLEYAKTIKAPKSPLH